MENIKKEMLSQPNRGTFLPLFIVVEDKKIWGMSPDYADGRERKDPDNIDHEWLCEDCQEKELTDEELPEDCEECDTECFVSYRLEKQVPNMRAAFFFTAKACDAHIAANPHHYNSTAHSYAISAYYNHELQTVMKFIVGPENEKKINF